MGNPLAAPPALRPERRRTAPVWSVLALLVALPVTGISLFRAIPAEWPLMVVQLLSFTPWVVLPAALAVVLAAVGRRVWVMITTAALLAVQLFWLFLWIPASRSNFRREGLEEMLPHHVSEPSDDASGGAVYSAFPLEPVGILPDTPFRMAVTRVLVADPGSGSTASFTLTNVHALPPVDERIGQWRSDLTKIAAQASRSGNQLLVGDYNSTFDHTEYRTLLGAGHGDTTLPLGH